MNINYRNYHEGDVEQIIGFWNQNSGWETDMDRALFNDRFCSSYLGLPIIMLAIDNDIMEIVAMFSFLPVSVTINGREGKAYRPFGAIFKESFRSKFGLTSIVTGSHPIRKLFEKGSELAKKEKAVVIYLIPDPRWERILRFLPIDTHKLPLWSYTLPVDPLHFNPGISVVDIDCAHPDIDKLWMKAPKEDACSVTRNVKAYRLKDTIHRGRFRLKAVYLNDEITGVFTIDFKKDQRQWVICDLLARDNDEALKITLQGALHAVKADYSDRQTESDKKYKAAVLATPDIEKQIKELGFYRDNYDFILAIQLLDKKNFSKAEVSPKKWQISAND